MRRQEGVVPFIGSRIQAGADPEELPEDGTDKIAQLRLSKA